MDQAWVMLRSQGVPATVAVLQGTVPGLTMADLQQLAGVAPQLVRLSWYAPDTGDDMYALPADPQLTYGYPPRTATTESAAARRASTFRAALTDYLMQVETKKKGREGKRGGGEEHNNNNNNNKN